MGVENNNKITKEQHKIHRFFKRIDDDNIFISHVIHHIFWGGAVVGVGNWLDFHKQSLVWPIQSMIDCIIGSRDAILKISAHGHEGKLYRRCFVSPT